MVMIWISYHSIYHHDHEAIDQNRGSIDLPRRPFRSMTVNQSSPEWMRIMRYIKVLLQDIGYWPQNVGTVSNTYINWFTSAVR